MIALPLLRPLRLLRLVTLLSVLNRQVGSSLRGRVAVYVGGATALVLFVAGIGILDAERHGTDPNITSLRRCDVVGRHNGDDRRLRGPLPDHRLRPIHRGRSHAGRHRLARDCHRVLRSWLLDKVREVEEASQAATQRDIAALTAEVRALREELNRAT